MYRVKPFLLSIWMVLLFSGLSLQSSAQSLDKVLEKHHEAMGLKKALEVKTMKSEGTASLMGGQLEMTMESTISRPNKIRTDMSFQGQSMVQCYNGEMAWGTNPMMGPEPAELPAEQAESLLQQSYIEGLLYNSEEKGYKVELVEDGEVDNQATYRLKVTPTKGNSDSQFLHLDKETYLLLKIDTIMKDPTTGQEAEGEIYYSNYKETDGIQVAYVVEILADGNTIMEMSMDKVEFNIDVDDKMFDMPE